MNFPDGLYYNPVQSGHWIVITTKAGEALITIDPTLGYTVNDRDFKKSFQDLFSEDYKAFARRYHLIEQSPVYSGAEHKGDPKLPNITVIPNIPTRRAQTVRLRFDRKTFDIGRDVDFRMPTGQEVTLFGCTMGHWHGQTDCPDGIQEVYEFLSYGALIIDQPESDEVELWVARDGDKVAVPQRCHMILYNLDDLDNPLITLDFANPNRNYANKELVRRIGPVLLAYYTPYEAVFVLNHRYINRERIYVRPDEFLDPNSPPPGKVDNQSCLNGGVHLPAPIVSTEGREVRIPLGARASLGQQLYEALTGDAEVIIKFAHLGIRVRKASPDIQLGSVWYGRPLAEAVKWGKASQLYRFFFSSAGNATQAGSKEKIPAPKRPLHRGEEEWLKKSPRLLEPGRKEGEPAQRDIQILIEGAGDWVDKAIIPSIEKAREELEKRRQGQPKEQPKFPDFRVVIADDSRWHSPGKQPPGKPDTKIYPELRRVIDHGLNQGKTYSIAPQGIVVAPRPVVFLDKAYPPDLQRYQRLRPGVVFIVTPDYTHSVLCQAHLDRAPTIFVEKPFDANWENVRALLEARGRAGLDTEIYALDHYRFYSWRLKETASSGKTLLEEATDWLGGALRVARFCMTETRPVEPHRIRALQYGLMLDMLSHCFGMLAFFGQLDTVDEFEVLKVGRYDGAPIPNETYAHVRFTFEDYSDNGWRVPCDAWVGKGLQTEPFLFSVVDGHIAKELDAGTIPTDLTDAFRNHGFPLSGETSVSRLKPDDWSIASGKRRFIIRKENGMLNVCLQSNRKHFEVIGRSGRSVLITLGDDTTWRYGQSDRLIEEGGIYFVDEHGDFTDDQGRRTNDPRAPLDKDRYKQLFLDLVAGELKAIVCAMPLVSGERIVHALDRFWKAIQARSPWQPYEFGELDCFQP